MAYQIHYNPGKKKCKRRAFVLTLSFFLIFLMTANLFFADKLNELRQLLFPQETWAAMEAFCQELFERYAD